jgi:hypothetical protein
MAVELATAVAVVKGVDGVISWGVDMTTVVLAAE